MIRFTIVLVSDWFAGPSGSPLEVPRTRAGPTREESRTAGVPADVEVLSTMSYLLYDFLLPILGPSIAEYWAQLLVVGPI